MRMLTEPDMAGVIVDNALQDARESDGATGQDERHEPQGSGWEHAQIFLLGASSLGPFLQLVNDAAVEGVVPDRAELTSEWRAAVDHYEELERTEAGIALEGDHRDLDPSLAALAAQVKSHPSYRRTFDTLPTSFGMVELDRLIVYQTSVTRNYVDVLKARIGPTPDAAAVFRVCLPLDAPPPPVEVQRAGPRCFVFRCESTHFRFREPALLAAQRCAGRHDLEAVAGVVGLAVGFGSSLLNVVRVGKRYLLNNGYHRAYALRALGLSHAPCVIQTATHVDEVQVVVNHRVAAQADFFLESARPPLLKDFFNPKLCKVLPMRRRVRHIEIRFEIRDFLDFE
jgi:hypothetical protein